MKLPSLFVGHGSPMIALEDNQITGNFKQIGDYIIDTYGKPKAILAISAHWFTRGSFCQDDENPRQIYDMYGFPQELYEVKYPAKGDKMLAEKIQKLLSDEGIRINNEWGIDHGTWTVLVHMFPKADIPIVQLSVNGLASEDEVYQIGEKLEELREEGYLIIGSGNIVHNLREAGWSNPGPTKETIEFDQYIVDAVKNKNHENILNHKENPNSAYAVPTKDRFYPLLYVLGASGNDEVKIFNQVGTLGSIAMTSFLFESK